MRIARTAGPLDSYSALKKYCLQLVRFHGVMPCRQPGDLRHKASANEPAYMKYARILLQGDSKKHGGFYVYRKPFRQ